MNNKEFLESQVINLRQLLVNAGDDPVLAPQLRERLQSAEKALSLIGDEKVTQKLRVYWGKLMGEKNKQLVFDGDRRDTRFLCYKVFTEEALKGLEELGYDLSTLKFSIEKK